MTISRLQLFGKLGTFLYRSLESATSFCKLRGNPHVELTHWLHQILQQPDGDLHRIVRHAGLSKEQTDIELNRALASLPAGASSISDFSWLIESAVEKAWVLATLKHSDSRIRGAWLIEALASTPELRRMMQTIWPSFSKLSNDDLEKNLIVWCKDSPESSDRAHTNSDLLAATPGEASGAIQPATQAKGLAQFCSDLTERAREGKIDPVIGREHDIRTMIDVLLRRRQNNPLLTGEAGVGKTALVEGLALAIAAGEVPPQLADVQLLALDVGALLAGASMKGEFEARLKGVLEAAANAANPVILFIDEVHTLIGAGGQAGTADAANLLKPALARGNVRTIGATTWAEYKRHIEKDPALTRRFQTLQILEPEEQAAIPMLRGLAQTFASHHDVIIRDEAVTAAVKLSHRFIPSRQLPDKAISLLDTACARVALSQFSPPRELGDIRQRIAAARVEESLLSQEELFGLNATESLNTVRSRLQALTADESVVELQWREQAEASQALIAARKSLREPTEDTSAQDHIQRLTQAKECENQLRQLQTGKPLVHAEVTADIVAEIVADWTGIPVGHMLDDEIATVRKLPDVLSKRVIGQRTALSTLSERVQTARAGLTDPQKPLGVFLLAGPSGVGKTETALALAEALYGGEQNLITINMSEYQEAHTVSGLKGAPPGYVGHGEGGVLTEAVRRRPYSVVLLDEVEKAHRDVHEVFYQVFDKGYMEDSDGRFIDFRNTTILLTSNVGAESISNMCLDRELIPEASAMREALNAPLLKVFPPAFLGRVTVVPYLALADSALQDIVEVHLNRVVKRMADSHGIELAYDSSLPQYIVTRCLVQETGARVLIAFIEQHVLPRLSALWFDSISSGQPIQRVQISVIDPALNAQEAFIFSVQTLAKPCP